MAIEKVKAYLRNYGMEERVLELDMSSATVELAAQALHCEPARIAKTLSFLVDGRAVLVVAGVTLCTLTARFAARKYVNSSYEEIFQ